MYILNINTGVIHTKPTKERCQVDDMKNKLVMDDWHELLTTLKPGIKFCAHCERED